MELQASELFRGFLHCHYKEICVSRSVTYELRNDLVWFSRGFDRPPLCDAVERFLTDLGFVVEDDFTRLVEQPIWVLGDRAYDLLDWHNHLLSAGGRAGRSVQPTQRRRSVRYRVQGRRLHRQVQQQRSAEAIDHGETYDQRSQAERPEHAPTAASGCVCDSSSPSPVTSGERIPEAP